MSDRLHCVISTTILLQDGLTVTLEKPLEYQHISISQQFGEREVESRGEVALLTRNILIR